MCKRCANMGLVRSRSTVGSSNIRFQFTPKYKRDVFENKKVPKQSVIRRIEKSAEKLGLIYHAHRIWA